MPTIACSATPDSVWPADGRQVVVTANATVSGGTGSIGATLVSASASGSSNDISGFTPGTSGTVGSVAANAGERYTLTYQTIVPMGPVLSCTTVVTVQPQSIAELAANAWSPVPSMPTPRSYLAAAASTDRIYAIGGQDFHGNVITPSPVEAYDPVQGTWSVLAPLNTARDELAAAVLNGRVYAIGGFDGNDFSPVVEVYDPATNSWSYAAPLQTPRRNLAAVAANGHILAIGGCCDANLDPFDTVEVYDPATDSWSYAASLPEPRTRLAAAAGLTDRMIYVVGGQEATSPLGGHSVSAVEALDTARGTWSVESPLPSAREQVAAARADDGRIYAIAGSPRLCTGACSPYGVDALDPVTHRWINAAPIPVPRSALAATFADGRIYVIGGTDGNDVLDTVQAYTSALNPLGR